MARDETVREPEEETSLLDRRNYLKLAGAAAASVATFNSGAAAATDYETIEVGSGETFRKNISDGETWENKLIDITADDAAFKIDTSGSSNWTIRNVGVKGEYPDRDNGSSEPFWVEDPSSSGTSTIENVYLGDGASGTYYDDADSAKATGMYVDYTHAGHLDIKRVNVSGWTDNGIYGSNCGNPDSSQWPGEGGTVTIDTAYSENCDVTGFRLGTTGSKFVNCVTNNELGRGFWAYYNEIDMVNCDAYYNDKLHVQVNDGVTLNITDSRASGDPTYGTFDGGGTVNGSFDSGARSSPPQGVPTTPEEAASGQSGSNSSPSCTLLTPSDGETISGTVTVEVEASDSEDDGTSLAVEVSIDGNTWQTASYDSGSGSYKYEWDTTADNDGDHTVQARVTDTDGATTESSQSTVTIDNTTDAHSPVVATYDLTEAGSPNPHAEITADWTVSDTDADLDTVSTVVYDSTGTRVDSSSTNVDGSTASGTDKFQLKRADGETFDVTVTVTDGSGNTASVTQSVSS